MTSSPPMHQPTPSEYDDWRQSLVSSSDPNQMYHSHPVWKAYTEGTSVKNLDWESTPPELAIAIYNDLNKNYQKRSCIEQIIFNFTHPFHPDVGDIPLNIASEITEVCNKHATSEADYLLTELVRTGLIKYVIEHSRRNGRVGDDLQIQQYTIPSHIDDILPDVTSPEILCITERALTHLSVNSTAITERYTQLMYERHHSPENRPETLFADWSQGELTVGLSALLNRRGIEIKHTEEWRQFLKVFSQSEFVTALTRIFTGPADPPTTTNYKDEEIPYQLTHPHDAAGLSGVYEPSVGENSSATLIGCVASFLTDSSLLQICDELEAHNEFTETILEAFLAFGGTQDGREAVYDRYHDHDAFPTNDVEHITLQFTENYDEWMNALISQWHTSGGSKVKVLLELAAKDIADNATNNDVRPYLNGMPFNNELSLSESIQKHTQRLYSETQNYYSAHDAEKWRTVYRIVKNVEDEEYIPGTVESWSELRGETLEFKSYNTTVLKREVQLKNVLATWESMEEYWSEEDVLIKKEWFVLGGGVKHPQQ